MIPAELLKADGSVDRTSVGGGEACVELHARGRGPTARPGSRASSTTAAATCRWSATAPAGAELPEIESLESVVVHSDSPPAGEFACSSELFNRIRTLVRWAQRSNLAHVITDCPHRERLGWLEQYHLNGPSLRYETDLTRLYAKGFADMADAQRPNGLVPDIAPEYVVFDGGFRDSPEWGSAIVLAAWQHYVWTGDDTPLRRQLRGDEALRRLPREPGRRATSWATASATGTTSARTLPATSQLTPDRAHRHRHLLRGHPDAVPDRGAARPGRRRDALRARTPPGRRPRSTGGSSTPRPRSTRPARRPPRPCRSCWVWFRRGTARRVLEALVRDVRAHGNGTTAGDVGYRYVLRALADGGRSDVIFDMNHQSEQAGLRVPAGPGRDFVDRGLGRQPALVAEPFHARADHRSGSTATWPASPPTRRSPASSG